MGRASEREARRARDDVFLEDVRPALLAVHEQLYGVRRDDRDAEQRSLGLHRLRLIQTYNAPISNSQG